MNDKDLNSKVAKEQEEVREYLAKIRKTVADSEAIIEQAELRIVETDRFLASQGLTREQVLNFKFTKEQRLAANEQLRRLGLPPVEEDEAAFDFNAATAEIRADQQAVGVAGATTGNTDELAERRRKFGNFMQEYRL